MRKPRMMTSAMAARCSRAGAVLLAGSIGCLGLVAGSADAATPTLYVSGSGSPGAADTSCATAAYSTIQSAVNAALAGDTIVVCPGVYPGGVSITTPALTLQGAQHGLDARTSVVPAANQTIVTADSTGAAGFYVGANNVTIDGFTVQGDTNQNAAAYGPGIDLIPTVSGGQIINDVIQNSIYGLYLNSNGVNQTLVQHDLFANNNQPGPASGNGIYSDGGVSKVAIDANRFVGCNNAGILFASTTAPQSNLVITNNQSEDSCSTILFSVSSSTISGNVIDGSGSPAGADGVLLGGGDSGITVTNNVIRNNTGSAVDIQNSVGAGAINSNITLQGNVLDKSNLGGGVTVGTGTYTAGAMVAATQNWWGDPSGPGPVGPGVGSDVSAQVDYFTWCLNPACTSFHPTGSAYTAVAPTRIADTRPGSGEPYAGQTLSPGGTVTVTVGSPVPATATAVALSVTAVDPSQVGFIAVYPGASASGSAASVLNFVAGGENCATPNCVVPNLVITKITGGQITIKNTNANGGTVNVVVDLEGYFDPSSALTSGAGHYDTLAHPQRLVDTRCGETPPVGVTPAQCSAENLPAANATKRTVASGGTLNVATGLVGASAAVVQLTATNTAANGFLTAYSGTGTKPSASNVNFVMGQTASTRAIVPVGSDGSINIANYFGTADVVVDLVGSFSDATAATTAGSLFTPIDPTRILDTRLASPIGPNASIPVAISGQAGIPADVNGQPTAAALNITEADSTAGGYLAVTPDPVASPTTSDANFNAGDIRANADLATLNATGAISIYNLAGNTDVVVDAFGFFSAP